MPNTPGKPSPRQAETRRERWRDLCDRIASYQAGSWEGERSQEGLGPRLVLTDLS